MGKGKRRDTKHHNSLNQENSRGRQASVKKANLPVQSNSQDRPKPTTSTTPTHSSSGKFSKRKIISNWDRYSEDDVSSKIAEEKLVQRLSQLLEQSVLQTTQSNFQPSLEALRHINTVDDDDIFSHAFNIDYDYLADSVSTFSIQERLDLNPLYCKGIDSSSSVTERSSEITVETQPLTSEAKPVDVTNASERISSASLLVTEKKQSTTKQDTVNATHAIKDNVGEDEDEMLSQLLAAKTEENKLTKDKLYKMSTTIDQTKTQLPDITDEENDILLEELLAQPI